MTTPNQTSEKIQELKRLAEKAAKITPQSPDDRALYDFDRAASPSTILALIEENERLRQGLTDFHKKLSDRADWLRSEYLKGGDYQILKAKEEECRYILRTAVEGVKG